MPIVPKGWPEPATGYPRPARVKLDPSNPNAFVRICPTIVFDEKNDCRTLLSSDIASDFFIGNKLVNKERSPVKINYVCPAGGDVKSFTLEPQGTPGKLSAIPGGDLIAQPPDEKSFIRTYLKPCYLKLK